MSTAGPSQGAKAPLGGSGPREAGERGGVFVTAGPSQGAKAPLGGSGPREAGERGGVLLPRVRVVRRPVHGVLLLDKPIGLSSNDALQKAKWLLRAEKAGHTGTLDPLATGVLPLCFGAATKFSALQLEANKTYEATAVLGIKTSTGDAEGEVIERRDVKVTQADIDRVAKLFTGPISQVPPMHSALKKDGKALYEYAREGITIEREARNVTIYKLNVALDQANIAQAAIKIVATVSKGTYIRTLGEDIGEALGCGAHLSALRRTHTGGLDIKDAVTLVQLEAMTDSERMACLQSVDSLLEGHAEVMLDSDNAGRFLSGLRRRTQLPDADQVAVYGDAPLAADGRGARTLLGAAHIKAGELIPTRLLSPIEIDQILTSQAATPVRAELVEALESSVRIHAHVDSGRTGN
jgi:tRNA pseudouridine55 synthase